MNATDARAMPAGGPPGPEDDVSLADFVGIVRRGWRIIAVVTVACVAVTTVAVFVVTPVYEAQVLLAPVQEEGTSALDKLAGSFGGFAELAGVDLSGGTSTKDEAVALLSSQVLARQFITEHNLMPVLFSRQWDAKRGAWDVHDPKDVPTLGDAYKLWDEDIRTVEASTTSDLVTLTIEWKDRELAQQWANELVRRVNEMMRARAIADAKSSIDYLNAELAKTDVVEVRLAIDRLIESEYKTMTLAKVRDEYFFRVIDPAVVPDADDFVSPKRLLLVIAAVIGGALLGLMVVVFRNALKPARRDTPD
jgi:capsular polysaccharide biosynthesis protein